MKKIFMLMMLMLICMLSCKVSCKAKKTKGHDLYQCIYEVYIEDKPLFKVESKEERYCRPFGTDEGLIWISDDVTRMRMLICNNCTVRLMDPKIIAKAGKWKEGLDKYYAEKDD